jgi:hypothetical protein
MRKPSESLVRAWTSFAIVARGSACHPNDEKRFWWFVLLARQQQHPLDRRLIKLMSEHHPIDQKYEDSLVKMIEIGAGLLDVLRGQRKKDR